LRQSQIREIADIQISHVQNRLLDQDIHFDVSTAAKDFLGKAGFDSVFGARPLKRAIQTYLETPLAKELLAGKFPPGTKITVEMHNNMLIFNPANV
jgi:ATP-dependent Clp protease ATP-binding subunit ClpB